MNPHPLFDSDWYLQQNPDVSAAGINSLQHYLQHGWHEGRDPHPLFDTSFYLENNPDIAAAGVNPLVHYSEHGWREGRDPHPGFDTSWYLSENKDVEASQINPLVHYATFGWKEGRDPNPHFSTTYYLSKNSDVKASGLNPLFHYYRYGINEGRKPNIDGFGTAKGPPRFVASKPGPTRQLEFDHKGEQDWIEQLRADPAYLRAHTIRPLVSVVMPTRNRLPLLTGAIDSVRAQTYQN